MSHKLSLKLWQHGVARVHGRHSVHDCLKLSSGLEFNPSAVISVGKAACAMAQGALDVYPTLSKLMIITKFNHLYGDYNWPVGTNLLEASHPIPDSTSRIAGMQLSEFVNNLKPHDDLLVLVSGGASSLVEHLKPNHDWNSFVGRVTEMITSDTEISEINNFRASCSSLKNGGLLSNFRGHAARSLLISDVPGNIIETIGSGLAMMPARYQASPPAIVACNEDARLAIVEYAQELGYAVCCNEETLSGPVPELARHLAETIINGPPGIYVWGGEPTINLPESPGLGGRNQALALHLALLLRSQHGIEICVAGTDGTDGPTEAAGGIIDGTTYNRITNPLEAIERAASFDALSEAGALVITGPTGTNVMDIIVAVKAV